MEHKILFTDLDDTLLDEDKKICRENREKIAQMLKQGHYFVIATGRPTATGKIVVKELGLTMPGCYMASFNGAVIYDCAAQRVLAQRTIPLYLAKEILDEAHKERLYIHSYQSDIILTEEHGPELEFYLSKVKMEYQLVQDIYSRLYNEPNKLIMIDLEGQGRLSDFRERHAVLKEQVNSFFSRNEYLEICPKDTDKGSAVSYISQFLGIPTEHTVAVGDERNDVPMMQAAHVGVAVANSHPQAKEAADYITDRDSAHGAIAEVIDKFILA
ncbi:MAG: Cof-type HAD-IIB family hydrolase [Lachnospiraceae bacterium]|nr:Cof-type HAD-IIB family hydrolase [Lachnospiraceae bacterium]